MHLVDGLGKLAADASVVFIGELDYFVFTPLVAVKTAFEGERVRYLVLLPSYDSTCTDLVGLNFETAIFYVE
jgi:hypothetical protein